MAANYVSDNNPDGTIVAQTTGKLAFFGGTPVVQPTGAAGAALSRGVAGAVLATSATSTSPGGVGVTTTAELGITLNTGTILMNSSTFAIASGDLLYVNKPTSQAGLGIGNVRISGTNVAAIQFSNFTAATITSTAAEKWGFVAIRGLPVLSAALTPASVAAAATTEQTFTVTGLRVGEVVTVVKPTAQATLNIVGARVVSANTLGITFCNVSATTAVTPTAETYSVFSTGGIDAHANVIAVQQYAGVLLSATASSSTGFALTMTGLTTSDIVMGVDKPTFQAGLTMPSGFVSAASVLGVVYGNCTASAVTPTSAEGYGVTIFRTTPTAPCVVYSAALTPTAVAPNTTAEQTFTPAGVTVVAGSVIWVNKPTPTAGLGIGGVRVSGTGSFCINYTNSTAATITPPAETYLIANFQQPIPDAGTTWIFGVNPQVYQNTLLTNAMRSALGPTGTNLMTGA